MKRIFTLMLALVLALSLAACGKRVEDDVTAAGSPAPTEAPTEEPTEAPTEEPTEGPSSPNELTFNNELDFPVTLSVMGSSFQYHSDPLARTFGGEAQPGESIRFSVDFSWEPALGQEYKPRSLICSDADGSNYYLDMLDLRPGSFITLCERDGERFYRVESEGETVEYPALTVKNSEPSPADERILGLNKQHFSGREAAEQACRDGFDHADFSYQLIALDDAPAAKYPKLRDALETERMAVYGRVIALYHSLVEECEHSGSSQRGDFRMEAFVRRADSRCFSVLYRFTLNYGGAATVYWASSNLDTATGRTIELGDAVTDIAAFTDALNAVCEGETIGADIWEDETNLCMPAFTLDHDGVSVFMFGENSGQSAFLPFGGYPELFKPAYLPETEDFTVEFPMDVVSSFETADGGVAEFMVSRSFYQIPFTTETEELSTDFTVYNGDSGDVFSYYGTYSSLDSACPELSEYLFVRSGGRDYFLVRGCNALSFLMYSIEISSGRLYALGCCETESSNTILPGISPIGLGGTSAYIITDPHCFNNCYRIDGLGSGIGMCPAGMGGDGVPVRLDNVYYIVPSMYSGMEYTLLCDIEGELVNEAGESIGTVTLHEGDAVVHYRTDGATWGDVKTADGRIVRFYITTVDDPWVWPPYFIGDMSIMDIFDGVGFLDW